MKRIISDIAEQFYEQIVSNYFFAAFFEGKDLRFIKENVKNFIYDQLTCEPSDVKFQKSYKLGVMHAGQGIPLNNILNFMDHFQRSIFEYCKDHPGECTELRPGNIELLRNWFAKGYLHETIKNTDIMSIPLFSVLSSTKIATSLVAWIMDINDTILSDLQPQHQIAGSTTCDLISFLDKPFFNMIFESGENYHEFNKMHFELHNIANSLMYFMDEASYIQAYFVYNDFIEQCRNFMNFYFERVVLFEQNNENYFYRFVSKKISNDRDVTFFLFNIRNMAMINKVWGHENGDFLVNEVERIIDKRHGMNSTNSVFIKTQNAEFIVLIINTAREKALEEFYTLHKHLENKIPKRGEFNSDIKISSAFIHLGQDTIPYKEHLKQLLQQGIVMAKMNGIKPLICGPEELQEINNRVLNDEKIKHFIRQSFNKDNFKPFYHTIVHASDQTTAHAEVLARVCDGDNCVGAASFIDYLVQTERIVELDKVMLEKVSADMDKLKSLVDSIFINISPKSLRSPSFIVRLNDFIHTAKKKKVKTVFEITEQSLFDHIELVRMLHEEHRSVFAIDDFGSGYSNFSIVSDLAQEGLIHFLKIDGTLIRDIKDNVYKENVVSGIINIAETLNLKTVAEFVSDEKTAKKLMKLGVTYLQGFHYSIPTPIERL